MANSPDQDRISTDAAEKRALLVSPSYKGLHDRLKLEGTKADVEIIKHIISSPPFSFNNIKELTEEAATRQNILAHLAELCRDAAEESVVLFYYSGHGYYLRDDEDEGIIPAEATSEMIRDGSIIDICITGYHFAPYLERLADKKISATFIFDCCYSGHVYRRLEYKDSKFKLTKPRQVTLSSLLEAEALQPKSPTQCRPVLLPNKEDRKWKRAGWRPLHKDKFFHIAACSSVEKAWEGVDKRTRRPCGMLTCAIKGVFEKLEHPEKMSYKALCSLIMREFKELKVNVKQTPQFEGGNMNTTVFGVDKVAEVKGIKVDNFVEETKEVLFDAGLLQLISDGEYFVYEPTVTQDELESGNESDKWVARIDINNSDIYETRAIGQVLDMGEGKAIRHGCVAYLIEPRSMRHNFLVQPSDKVAKETTKELLKHLKASKMANLHKATSDKDVTNMIIICEEIVEGRMFWVARRNNQVIAPPISLGKEEFMVENLRRFLRYEMAQEQWDSDKHLMINVSFKVTKIEKVVEYPTITMRNERVKQGLINEDLYPDSPHTSRPKFQAHSVDEQQLKGRKKLRPKPRSGDAIVFQVKNNEQEAIHICVLMYQLDGSIVSAYPDRSGATVELRKGDTAEGIHRLFIPKGALRAMAGPDTREPEPDYGVDTLILYATSHPADYGPLLQTAIETEPELVPRDGEEDKRELNPLEEFRLAIKPRCSFDLTEDEQTTWLVESRAFEVVKHVELNS